MKKRRRRPADLMEALEGSSFVKRAARRAFAAFLRRVLREDERGPRRTA